MGIDVCNWNGNNTCLLLSLFSLPRSGSIFTLIVFQFCFILAWLWTHIGFDRVSNHLHVGLDWKNNGNHHWKSMKKLNGCIENHWRTIGNHWKYKWNHWKSIKANGKHWNSFTNESTSLIIIEKRIRIIEHNWSKPTGFIGIIENGCASEGYFVGGGRPSGHVPPRQISPFHGAYLPYEKQSWCEDSSIKMVLVVWWKPDGRFKRWNCDVRVSRLPGWNRTMQWPHGDTESRDDARRNYVTWQPDGMSWHEFMRWEIDTQRPGDAYDDLCHDDVREK